MLTSRLLLTALFAVLAMSSVPVLVKSVQANEVTIALARLLTALVVMTPIMIARREFSGLVRSQYVKLAQIGLVFGVHWITYFASIKLATASIAAAAISTYGIQYLILAWWFNHERLGKIEIFAASSCFAGCLLLVPSFSLENSVSLGIMIGVFSGFLYACLPLLHQRADGINLIQRTWGQFSFAFLFIVFLWPLSDWNLPESDWPKLAVLGVLCTVIAHGLWVKSSTELPAIYTALIYYLYIPIAMLSSAVILGEVITIRKFAGASIIIIASVIVALYRVSCADNAGSRASKPGPNR